MAHALNLVLKLKQDPESLAELSKLKENFETDIQPKIDRALRDSKIVHFARVFVIDDKYLLVITEYDGGHREYTDFFRRELPSVFEALFSLTENAPPWSDLNNEQAFFSASKHQNIRSLGKSDNDDKGTDGQIAGYLFSAYGQREVKEILNKIDS